MSAFGGATLRDRTTGTINWKDHGVYKLTFDAESSCCTSITHRPTGDNAELPAHVIITTSFVLEESWADFSAKATFEPSSCILCKFFARDFGPHNAKLLSGDNAEWRLCVGQEESKFSVEKEKMRSKTVVAGPIGKKVKDAKRKASMVKAREALLKQKADIKNKRLVCLK